MSCLDWLGGEHWSPRATPCRWCGGATHLRDAAGRATHKVCIERVIDEQEMTG